MSIHQIHPTAYVAPSAILGDNVEIGPFTVVEPGVVLGAGCRVAGHVTLKEGVEIGPGNEISEGAVIGGKPQHLKAGDRLGRVVIGRGNQIREFVTIHRGLHPHDVTRVGDNCLLMVNVHVAHDCHVGNQVILANNVMLAGHVTVGDHAYISGAAGVHQFCRVGAHAMVGGQAHLNRDVPPFVTVDGLASQVVGLNSVGLKRRGFSAADLLQLKAAYRLIYRSGMLWGDMLKALLEAFPTGPAAEFHPFFVSGKRGFTPARRATHAATLRIEGEEEGRAGDDGMRKAG